jgi:phosphoribosylglycinamide formyltransferase-1
MSLSSPQLATAESRRSHLVKICEALPEVAVEPANEHLKISIRKKTLAYYSFDHHGDGMISLVCKSSPNDQRRMIRSDPETFFVPDYLGAKGWLGIRLDLAEVDWDVVTDSLRRAYQDLAPKKLVIQLLAETRP